MRTLYLALASFALLAAPLVAWGDESQFVPLTNLPGIQQAASSETLPAFLNNLYRLCIGAAAVIAILQIMRAGAYFMFNKGSVAHNENAKKLITNSVLGLLLVLSPAIVFGIINPDILDLRLDVGGLKLQKLQELDVSTTFDNGQTSQVTGTVLKTGRYRQKAGMETFVNQCNNPALTPGEHGIGSTHGCVQQCSNRGEGGCDAEGCAEYVGYCSIVQRGFIVYMNPDQTQSPRFEFREADQALVDDFVRQCSADRGTFRARVGTQNVACPAGSEYLRTCTNAEIYCAPPS